MNLEIVNQVKNDFLNNNHNKTLKTQLILSYTPAPGATPISFHLKLVEAISLQKNEIYFHQGK